jgi:hypothetical protein
MEKDIACRIDLLPAHVKPSKICAELDELLTDSEMKVHHHLSMMPVICQAGDTGYQLLSSVPICNYCLVIDASLSDAMVFFITRFLHEKQVTSGQAFRLLKIAREAEIPKKNMFRLFHHLRWPSGSKGFSYLDTLLSADDRITAAVESDRIALVNAVMLLHAAGKSGSAERAGEIMDKIPLRATFSQLNVVTRLISEYMLGSGCSVDEVLQQIDFSTREKMTADAEKLRFPVSSSLIETVDSCISGLALPGSVSITYDKTFEKRDHTLSIVFNSLPGLTKTIIRVLQRLDEAMEHDHDFECLDFDKIRVDRGHK